MLVEDCEVQILFHPCAWLWRQMSQWQIPGTGRWMSQLGKQFVAGQLTMLQKGSSLPAIFLWWVCVKGLWYVCHTLGVSGFARLERSLESHLKLIQGKGQGTRTLSWKSRGKQTGLKVAQNTGDFFPVIAWQQKQVVFNLSSPGSHKQPAHPDMWASKEGLSQLLLNLYLTTQRNWSTDPLAYACCRCRADENTSRKDTVPCLSHILGFPTYPFCQLYITSPIWPLKLLMSNPVKFSFIQFFNQLKAF